MTNTSRTAREHFSSMVKARRDQSQEAPSFLSCSTILPPYFSFHSHAYLRNSSRVRLSFSMPCFLSCSTILTSVAIEAWSVPGSQSAQ